MADLRPDFPREAWPTRAAALQMVRFARTFVVQNLENVPGLAPADQEAIASAAEHLARAADRLDAAGTQIVLCGTNGRGSPGDLAR